MCSTDHGSACAKNNWVLTTIMHFLCLLTIVLILIRILCSASCFPLPLILPYAAREVLQLCKGFSYLNSKCMNLASQSSMDDSFCTSLMLAIFFTFKIHWLCYIQIMSEFVVNRFDYLLHSDENHEVFVVKWYTMFTGDDAHTHQVRCIILNCSFIVNVVIA